MSKRLAVVSAIAALGMGVWVWISASNARAGEASTVASAPPPAAVAVEDSPYEYIGASKCKMCHLSEYKSWKKTDMARAFDTLKPGKAAEAKQKHGLDPNKDDTTDQTCLACHTTGYGHPGGYAIPDANDRKAVRAAKKLENIGCEGCHGPGSAYIKVFKDIFRSKRRYKVEELHAVGLRVIDATVCAACHNDKSPTYDPANPLDFEKAKATKTHARKKLKLRED